MANQYKNKIIYGDQTLMDITDTTATENDVLEGEVFYGANGARSVGVLGDATQSTHGLMSATDKTKLDGFLSASNYLTSHQDISGKANSADLATVATTGSYADLLNKPDLSQYLTSVPTMTGATSSANGTAGLIPAPTSADYQKFFRGDGTWQDGGRPMVILSYGNSTWNDFITAYNNNVIVYCRASSNSNPASGSQTRMAFMAYVNNATSPTEVEFQYYRSMNAHSATAMGDEVYVYKLTSAGAWTVTVRKASIKEIAVASGSKLGVSWSSDKVTLSNTMTANDMPMSSSDATTTKAKIDALNSNIKRTKLTSATNFDNLKVTEEQVNAYYCGNNLGQNSGIPSGSWGSTPFSLDVVSMAGYTVQSLTIYGTNLTEYKRQTYYSGGSVIWGPWNSLSGFQVYDMEKNSSSENDKPWLVINRLFSSMPNGKLIGTIECAGYRNYFGYKNGNYGAFYVDMYSHLVPAYRVVVSNGTTMYTEISTGSWTIVT